MRTLTKRVAALEVDQGPGAEPSSNPPVFVRWWSRPILPGVLWDFMRTRAHRRFVGAGNVRYDWYRLPQEERDARAIHEWNDLATLVESDGAECALQTWEAAAASWPRIFGDNDLDSLDRQLRHAWNLADDYRGSSPLFRRTWPEWHPAMTDAERFAFDHLLEEEGDTRLATLPQSVPALTTPNTPRQRSRR